MFYKPKTFPAIVTHRAGGERIRPVEPRARIELLDLGKRKVDCVKAPLWRAGLESIPQGRAARENLRDVGCAIEFGIVNTDEHAVLRDLQVLLNEVGALFDGQFISSKRVLGRVTRGPAMRDQYRAIVVRG